MGTPKPKRRTKRAPKVEILPGVRASCVRYVIEVDDGSGPRRWEGDTVEGFSRDLAAATSGKATR